MFIPNKLTQENIVYVWNEEENYRYTIFIFSFHIERYAKIMCKLIELPGTGLLHRSTPGGSPLLPVLLWYEKKVASIRNSNTSNESVESYIFKRKKSDWRRLLIVFRNEKKKPLSFVVCSIGYESE